MIRFFKRQDKAVETNNGGLLKKLGSGLQKTRDHFTSRITRLFSTGGKLDEDFFEELEEILITSDVGVAATKHLVDRLSDEARRQGISDAEALMNILQKEIIDILEVPAEDLDIARHKPFVILVIGINGVGKTTNIAKMAYMWKQEGRNPLIVAADTFRAAAIEQLTMWGERINVPVIRQKAGADPSAVVFDALDAAMAREHDVVLIDTAGRMHTRTNLMEELKKVNRVISRKIPGAPHETFLVLDATTGQNAISQVRLFREGVDITGLVLAKMDGTAKGGIIIGICHEFQIPVRFIGVGEGLEDLRPFDAGEFTKALFEDFT